MSHLVLNSHGALTVLERPNPFDPQTTREELALVPGQPLARYLEEKHGDLLVFLDGKLIPPERRMAVVPHGGQQIVLAHDLGGGGGGKSIVRSLAMLAVVAVAAAMPFLMPGLATNYPWLMAGIMGAISVGGGALINALMPPPTPAKSQTTYSWSGPAMTAQQGIPIPIQAGQILRGPNVIESYVKSSLTQEWLALLLDFGWGPAESISQITINGNPLSNYPGIWTDTRLGYLNQQPMQNFSEVVNSYPQNQRLVSNGSASWGTSGFDDSKAFTYIGQGTRTQAVEFEFTFPSGLWAGPNDDASYDPWTVYVGVAYRKVGQLDWTSVLLPRTTSGLPNNEQGQAPYWIAVTSQWSPNASNTQYVLAVDYSSSAHKVGDKYTATIEQTIYDSGGNPVGTQNVNVTGTWQINPNGPGAALTAVPGTNYAVIGDYQNSTHYCSWNKTQLCRDVVRIDNLDPGQYEYMVAKLGACQHPGNTLREDTETSSRRGEETWLSAIREIEYAKIGYQGKILLGIYALATNTLSGGAINVQAVVKMAATPAMGYKNEIAYDQPAAYFRMGDASAAACADSSGNGHGGVYAGAPELQQPALIVGSPNQAAKFAAADSVTLGNAISLPSTGWALSFWVELDASMSSASAPLFSSADGSVYVGLSNGHVNFHHGGGDHLDDAVLTPGVAHHVAIGVTAGGILVMVDGVPNDPNLGTMPSWPLAKLGGGFAGILDEIAMFDYAIQPGRLKQHYMTGTIGAQSQLEDRRADNPAMVAIDLLTNPIYGAQQSPALLEIDKFRALADFNDQLVSDGQGGQVYRHIFNGVFDKTESVWSALGRLGQMCQAAFVRLGAKYSVVYDGPQDIKQIFTMGNIKKDSFRQSWPALLNRANTVSGRYLDETNSYKTTPIRVMDEPIIAAGQPVQDAGMMDLFGVTNPRAAWRILMYRLMASQAALPAAQIECALEGMGVGLGDVVGLQHDVPQWGKGGRVLDVLSPTEFRLDQRVTVEGGKSYVLMVVIPAVRICQGIIMCIMKNVVYVACGWDGSKKIGRLVFGDLDLRVVDATYAPNEAILTLEDAGELGLNDSVILYDTNVIETRAVTNAPGTSDRVTIDEPFSAGLMDYATYFFGQLADLQTYRVSAVGRRSNQEMTLQLVNYDPDLYGDLEPVLPVAVAGANAIACSDLAAVEAPTSTPQFPLVSLKWTPGVATAGTRIYATHDGLTEYLVANVKESYVQVPVTSGAAYTFRAVGYNAQGFAAPYASAPTATVTPQGIALLPQNVASFYASACTSSSVTLDWAANPSADNVDHYEIRYGGTVINPDWTNAAPLTPNPAGAATSATFASGPGNYLICAVTAAGVYSAVPTGCSAVVGGSTGGTGGGGYGGGTSIPPACFSGNVEIRTPDGPRAFESLPREERFWIRNRTGDHLAELLVHNFDGPMLDFTGNGDLVTLDHLMETAPCAQTWHSAQRHWPHAPEIRYRGEVFNLHVLSERPEDHHYILEATGESAHNLKNNAANPN